MNAGAFVEKVKRYGKPIAASAAVGVFAFAILWNIQYASPRPLGVDIYYHLKFAQLTAERGLIKEFPWCQFSLFKDHFADKEFLYHFLLVPFVRHDIYQAGKLFPIWLGTALIVMLYLILRYHGAVYPWLWLILMIAWTPTFLYRFSMPRPHLLAIAIKVRLGCNVLDLKIFQMDLDWGFYCWITDDKNEKVLKHTEKGWAWKDRRQSEVIPPKSDTPTNGGDSPSTAPLPAAISP